MDNGSSSPLSSGVTETTPPSSNAAPQSSTVMGLDLRAEASYALTILVGAFLLFQVQPMLGKFILPWFGGGPAVWSACLLFFQAFLLGGYWYAHLLTRWLRPRAQAVGHVVLLLASLAALPITPAETWKPHTPEAPALHILLLLAACVGVPYLLLSSTGPLLQFWFSRTRPGVSPYRLYAVSNVGSLLGLLAYPFLVEPRLGLHVQTGSWSVAYGGYVLLTVWLAVGLYRSPVAGTYTGREEESAVSGPPSLTQRLLWLALPACGSLLLLATTNQITQDVAPVPLLWVLPLALYLVTFILCFENERIYDRRVWIPAFLLSAFVVVVVMLRYRYSSLLLQVSVFCAVLFSGCMVCHGELVRLKPDVRHLTGFYLMVALGGAVGGAFVSLAAPFLFNGFWEFPLGVVVALLLLLVCLARDGALHLANVKGYCAWCVALACTLVLTAGLAKRIQMDIAGTLAMTRNFYGVLTVSEYAPHTPQWRRNLCNGHIIHGTQYLRGPLRHNPTSYYGAPGGFGLAVECHPRRLHSSGNGFRIGVVGLGAGTIAAFGQKGDTVRFYEINPEVVRISGEYFTYRKDSPADVQIVLGDARLSMERELAAGHAQHFDVLALDAFTSDSIPVHLLTREAARLYWRELKPDGILAVHISAEYLDLVPVVRALAEDSGKQAALFIRNDDRPHGVYFNKWVLITSNQEFLANKRVRKYLKPWTNERRDLILWTDDYSNLFRILK